MTEHVDASTAGRAPGTPGARRNGRLRFIVVVSIVAVTLIVCGAGLGRWYFGQTSAANAEAAANTATAAFITDIQQQRSEAAYGKLCARTKRAFTLEEFTGWVRGEKPGLNYRIIATDVRHGTVPLPATVVAELRYQDGSTDRHGYDLVEEGGAWKVCWRPY